MRNTFSSLLLHSLKPQARRLMPFLGLVFALVILLSSCTKESPYVVMLSLDGFRWDYTQKVETPNFDRLVNEGVHAASLKPCYPSKTFPNHYSMATGLYPDHHGIVQNNFYDPVGNKLFDLSNREAVGDSTFWGGEPIWATAERQGVRAASYFWVGTETNSNYQPHDRKMYDEDLLFENRIDSVINWLRRPKNERPHLVLFYYHQPDGVGHQYGPESQEVVDMVKALDAYVGQFLDKLEAAETELGIKVNIIVTSDHGMGAIKRNQTLVLSSLIDTSRLIRVQGGNPVFMISPDEDYKEELLEVLGQTQGLKVWRKEELPPHYHYGTHPRVESIIVEADRGWGLQMKPGRSGSYSKGTHGYDPQNTDMHGIFYARGPAFKQGYSQESFENVNLYPLIAHILNLKPAQTDGKLAWVQGMLKE